MKRNCDMARSEERVGAEGLRIALQVAGSAVLALVLLVVVAKITSMVHIEGEAKETIDSREAVVKGKRTEVRQGAEGVETLYYMTFQRVDGVRIELEVPGEDYGLTAEGDEGILVMRGSAYFVFKRVV